MNNKKITDNPLHSTYTSHLAYLLTRLSFAPLLFVSDSSVITNWNFIRSSRFTALMPLSVIYHWLLRTFPSHSERLTSFKFRNQNQQELHSPTSSYAICLRFARNSLKGGLFLFPDWFGNFDIAAIILSSSFMKHFKGVCKSIISIWTIRQKITGPKDPWALINDFQTATH